MIDLILKQLESYFDRQCSDVNSRAFKIFEIFLLIEQFLISLCFQLVFIEEFKCVGKVEFKVMFFEYFFIKVFIEELF